MYLFCNRGESCTPCTTEDPLPDELHRPHRLEDPLECWTHTASEKSVVGSVHDGVRLKGDDTASKNADNSGQSLRAKRLDA